MKRLSVLCLLSLSFCIINAQTYTPTAANIKAREAFTNDRFGLFIHWGPFSIPGSGEWVMNQRSISFHNYKRLMDFFNPIDFNAKEWVSLAKSAGMKYITLITRHHDGFSMWNTKYSDFNIMNTPYKKDIVKQVAGECHRQGIKLFLYYSLLDWGREDYPYLSGRTGQTAGRTSGGNYPGYLQFMKNQLTELLTNYGEINGVWFDGHWDQTRPEGEADRSSAIDWKYEEIYQLIHQLQPACLVGNNHHLYPFNGEDFQMFERDLPGENKSGLSFQKASDQLPVETCETMNNSWGFNITDTSYKSAATLIGYLANAAGRNANFLLNVGPMPNGKIQPEFVDTLKKMGQWLRTNGATIYNSGGNIIPPQLWGTATRQNNSIFLHITNYPIDQQFIIVPAFGAAIKLAAAVSNGNKLTYKQVPQGWQISLEGAEQQPGDTIIRLDVL